LLEPPSVAVTGGDGSGLAGASDSLGRSGRRLLAMAIRLRGCPRPFAGGDDDGHERGHEWWWRSEITSNARCEPACICPMRRVSDASRSRAAGRRARRTRAASLRISMAALGTAGVRCTTRGNVHQAGHPSAAPQNAVRILDGEAVGSSTRSCSRGEVNTMRSRLSSPFLPDLRHAAAF
jgi:hypothetical protein